ncbi:MAG: exopolysaccharide biosynthesis polyprenyl glycosylphosphotransferase [Candidatus Pacebacteria bacterium]|nr:exopolysaccharide biosynthesis polyprenyl glycosylphosphotransferase [Candidatus Paceibacterota bacterium]
MARLQKPKIFLILAGDAALFYICLYLSLFLRHQKFVDGKMWYFHQFPFLTVHMLWIVVFYIAGLYELKNFYSIKKTGELVLKTMAAAVTLAVFVFYLIPYTNIEPKTTLLIDATLLLVLLTAWRHLFWLISGKTEKTRVLFLGESKEIRYIAKILDTNPYLGYESAGVMAEVEGNLTEIAKNKNADIIAASRQIMGNAATAKKLYETVLAGISVMDFENFYESLVERIPVYLISEEWFLKNLFEINKKIYKKIKRAFDLVLALILCAPTIILFPFLAVLIRMWSKGPVFYRQKRVGKDGKIFELIKLRTMVDKAEKNGAVWTKQEDPRITGIGNFLRKTRLDELPQLINVIRGEMSFIGPRPERPEFVKDLEKEVPHYAMRHIVKPGLSGWAQIKFPYGASVEDAMEKLQYDLYYIKNRSLILDIAITAKTISVVLGSKGR